MSSAPDSDVFDELTDLVASIHTCKLGLFELERSRWEAACAAWDEQAGVLKRLADVLATLLRRRLLSGLSGATAFEVDAEVTPVEAALGDLLRCPVPEFICFSPAQVDDGNTFVQVVLRDCRQARLELCRRHDAAVAAVRHVTRWRDLMTASGPGGTPTPDADLPFSPTMPQVEVLSAADLAKHIKKNRQAVQSCLYRLRKEKPWCAVRNPNKRSGEAEYLYRVSDVWTHLVAKMAKWSPA